MVVTTIVISQASAAVSQLRLLPNDVMSSCRLVHETMPEKAIAASEMHEERSRPDERQSRRHPIEQAVRIEDAVAKIEPRLATGAAGLDRKLHRRHRRQQPEIDDASSGFAVVQQVLAATPSPKNRSDPLSRADREIDRGRHCRTSASERRPSSCNSKNCSCSPTLR